MDATTTPAGIVQHSLRRLRMTHTQQSRSLSAASFLVAVSARSTMLCTDPGVRSTREARLDQRMGLLPGVPALAAAGVCGAVAVPCCAWTTSCAASGATSGVLPEALGPASP